MNDSNLLSDLDDPLPHEDNMLSSIRSGAKLGGRHQQMLLRELLDEDNNNNDEGG